METVAPIALAILLPGALIVGLIVWRHRRREAEAEARRAATAVAWGETAADDTRGQTDRPIWRPD